MKDGIIIQFDPFDKESRVFVYKDGKTQVT